MNMIDFKMDGPFEHAPRREGEPPLRIIGLGQLGAHCLDQLVLHSKRPFDLVLIDTDRQTLEGSVVEEKHLAGENRVKGLGCGGDAQSGREIATESVDEFAELVGGYQYIMVAVGLGGGTGTGLVFPLIDAAQKAGAKVVVLATLPLGCESRLRREQAAQGLKELRETADCVLVMANESASALPEAAENIRYGFHMMNQHLGRTLQAVADLLVQRGLIQLHFADLRSLFGRLGGEDSGENCWMGWAEMGREEGIETLVGDVLGSPLLGGEQVWAKADHALVGLAGGKELSLMEVQAILQEVSQRLPKPIPVAVGAHLEDDLNGKLRMTLLLASTQGETKPESAVQKKPAAAKPPKGKVAAKKPVVVQATETGPLLHDTQPIMVRVPPRVKLVPKTSAPPEEELLPGLQSMAMSAKEAKARSKAAKHLARQYELPLEAASRGRFEKSSETIYHGEDLDIPTFRRRRLQIRL
jgi:cell division protein FtsZ